MMRYYTTSLFVFSTVGGIITYLLVAGFSDTPTAVLCSAVSTLMISIAIPALFAASDRKFMPLRKEINSPIITDERVNYVVGDDIRQGFMITTEHSLFILSTDEKRPVKFEIKKSEIKKVSVSDGVYLNIFLDFDKCIRIFGANSEYLSSKLKSEGFGQNY